MIIYVVDTDLTKYKHLRAMLEELLLYQQTLTSVI